MNDLNNLTSFRPKKVKRLRTLGLNVIFYYIKNSSFIMNTPQNERPQNFKAIL